VGAIDPTESPQFEVSPTEFVLMQSVQAQERSNYVVVARYQIGGCDGASAS
jgi:hypothetical protein